MFSISDYIWPVILPSSFSFHSFIVSKLITSLLMFLGLIPPTISKILRLTLLTSWDFLTVCSQISEGL